MRRVHPGVVFVKHTPSGIGRPGLHPEVDGEIPGPEVQGSIIGSVDVASEVKVPAPRWELGIGCRDGGPTYRCPGSRGYVNKNRRA